MSGVSVPTVGVRANFLSGRVRLRRWIGKCSVEWRLELASVDGENQRYVGGLVGADCEVVGAGRGKCHSNEVGGDEGDVEKHIDGLRSGKCLKFGNFVWRLRSWKFIAKMMLLIMVLMLRWRLRGDLSGLYRNFEIPYSVKFVLEKVSS